MLIVNVAGGVARLLTPPSTFWPGPASAIGGRASFCRTPIKTSPRTSAAEGLRSLHLIDQRKEKDNGPATGCALDCDRRHRPPERRGSQRLVRRGAFSREARGAGVPRRAPIRQSRRRGEVRRSL